MRRLLIALLVLAGLGLLVGILVAVDPGAVWAQMVALGPWGFAAMLANDLLATALWIASWGLLLRAQGVTTRWSTISGAAVSGFAISYITPVAYTGGEPVRAWLVSRSTSRPLTAIYASILVDRLLAGISLVTFGVLGGISALAGPALPAAAKPYVALALGGVVVAVTLGVLSFGRNLHWLSRIVAFLTRRTRVQWGLARFAEKVRETEDDVYRAFTVSLPVTLAALALQLGSFAFTYLRPQLFFYFTDGRWFSLPELALYFNLNAVLGTLLWLTPAGVGTAEGGRMGILHLLEVAPEAGVAFSLMVRVLELTVVALGLLYLAQRGMIHVVRKRRKS